MTIKTSCLRANYSKGLRENSGREIVVALDGIASSDRAIDADAAARGERTSISSSTRISESDTQLTENFLDIAQKDKYRVLPCGVDIDIIKKTINFGFNSFSSEERERYVSDPSGFVTGVTSKGFKRYSDTVIASNFAHKSPDDAQLSAEKFLSVQILQNRNCDNAKQVRERSF